MKLWTVEECVDSFVIENDKVSLTLRDHIIAQKICDEHNAWVILAERGWMVCRYWPSLTWGVHKETGEEIVPNSDGLHATPVAAILAADAWMRR